MTNKNQQVFFALVRAGLWEKDVQLLPYGEVDYTAVMRLAQEQTVVGLVAAGLEHVKDVKIPQEWALQFAGQTLQLEQRNTAMNSFIASIVKRMQDAGIYTLIVKGQGVAQCYERPLWRSSGDVDFFLNEENFLKAREFLRHLVEDGYTPSNDDARNISAKLSSWDIELHTDMYCDLSGKIDRGIKEVQKCVFYEGRVRIWMDGHTQVFLPDVNNDIIIIFTHFLKHFYKGGLGIRQICDWCRLLWTYRDTIDLSLLERRLKNMRILTEWKAFAAFAVDILGMPSDAMPLYSSADCWNRKARRIMLYIMKVGNMGHNRDLSFYGEKNRLIRKVKAFNMRTSVLITHFRIFPLNTFAFFPYMVYTGLKSYFRGE